MPSEVGILSRSDRPILMAGTRVCVPFRPAAQWCADLARIHYLVVDLADDEGRDALVDLVMDGSAGMEDLRSASFRLLEEATGRKWWEAGRLMSSSLDPEILGRLVLAGVDPWHRSIGEWCAAVYALAVKGQDEKGRMRFEFSLSIPPVGYEDQWDDGMVDPAAVQASVAGLSR